MTLTESDANQLLEITRSQLESIGAREVLEGVEESRRLGVEEALSAQDKKEMKQVGAMRRRPVTAVEELEIFLRRLEERLVVLPRLAASIRNRLQATEVEWRVDTKFVSETRIPEVSVTKLLPEGHEDVSARLARIMRAAEIATGETGE